MSARTIGVSVVALCLVVSLFSWRRAGPAFFNADGEVSWDAHQAGTWRNVWRRPAVGSQAWLDSYPGLVTGPAPRAEWLARYQKAKQAGLVVDVPQAELVGGLAHYPERMAMSEAEVCSYRRTGCFGPDDVVQGPSGTWAINFDDGPLPPSAHLYRFLDKQNAKATHFWVGHNVKQNLNLAIEAAKRGDHLAVHTWSHAHLTTRSDEEIVGELGWTMQIIYDVSGHVPKHMRPPFGDTDARVRSIAKRVFGLESVIWNDDSEDWALDQRYAVGDFIDPPYAGATVEHSEGRLTGRMRGGQEVGVIFLEHELSNESVEAFTRSFPLLKELGWQSGALPEVLKSEWYQ